MRRDDISEDLSSAAFEFFYAFSRFEFALKENGYLKSTELGAKAEPGWDKFALACGGKYTPCDAAQRMLEDPPERQIVGPGSTLTWQPVGLDDCASDLARVVRLLRIVRNNLFHGGKHGGAGWDHSERSVRLLKDGNHILTALAQEAGLEGDFRRIY